MKRYQSVSEMLEDSDFRREFDVYIKERQVIKQLMILRSLMGLSSEDIAILGDIDVEEMESGTDANLSMDDIASYLGAINGS